jgi:trehalose 6-phosphate phosphatase
VYVLSNAGVNIVVSKLTEIENKMAEINQLDSPENLPHALENIGAIFEMLEGKVPVLFFDYDGTLTPIVEDPNDANLSDRGRKTLEKLAKQLTVAVVSGRGLADLKAKVGVDAVFYAGSHGFEITGPGDLELQYEEGQKILPQLDHAERALKQKLEGIKGCMVERKKYAIAVHYRKVADENLNVVKNIVHDLVESQDNLKIGKGKMILELKPDLDWHKGKALNWLVEKLELNTERYKYIFFGDDITDEDALKVVRENGIGILIGTHGQKTYANYRLEESDDVYQFLDVLWKWYKGAG